MGYLSQLHLSHSFTVSVTHGSIFVLFAYSVNIHHSFPLPDTFMAVDVACASSMVLLHEISKCTGIAAKCDAYFVPSGEVHCQEKLFCHVICTHHTEVDYSHLLSNDVATLWQLMFSDLTTSLTLCHVLLP
jgi:hypothetical protein